MTQSLVKRETSEMKRKLKNAEEWTLHWQTLGCVDAIRVWAFFKCVWAKKVQYGPILPYVDVTRCVSVCDMWASLLVHVFAFVCVDVNVRGHVNNYMTYFKSSVDLYVRHNVSILLLILSPTHDAFLHGDFCTCKICWIQWLLSDFMSFCFTHSGSFDAWAVKSVGSCRFALCVPCFWLFSYLDMKLCEQRLWERRQSRSVATASFFGLASPFLQVAFLPGQWHGRTLILLLLVLVQWAALVPLLQYKDMTDLHASVTDSPTDWFQHVSTFLRLFAAVS